MDLPVLSGSSPYESLLGNAFGSLHAHVRRAHLAPLRAEGEIDVEHGREWWVRPMVWLMKLPAAGPRQPVQLEVVEDRDELVWSRQIGRSELRTRQHASESRLVERSGPGRVSFDLIVQDGALTYRNSMLFLAGLPVPSTLSPSVAAVVAPTADGWRVAVTVEWRGKLVCRYAGAMRES